MAKKPQAPNRPQPPVTGAAIQVQNVSQSFEGPLPPPSLLKQYNDAVDGAAERILTMAEQESLHRRAQENAATQANIAAQQQQLQIARDQTRAVFRSDTIGQSLGFVVSLASVIGCVYLALNGQPWVATALAGLPLVGIIRALRERPRPPK